MFAVLGPTRTTTSAAADNLHYLLAIVVERAKEHPTLQAVETAALLSAVVFLVGGGRVRTVR
jgi:hypothetical protein